MGFGLGLPEMMVVGFIALLLFGKELPKVALSVGKSFKEFKKGLSGIDDDLNASTYSAYNNAGNARPIPNDENLEALAPKLEPSQI